MRRDRHGRSLVVIEAKRYPGNPGDAAAQAKADAQQLGVPCAFPCHGDEVLFWEWPPETEPWFVETIFKRGDLERRMATPCVRRDPATVAIDRRIGMRVAASSSMKTSDTQALMRSLKRKVGETLSSLRSMAWSHSCSFSQRRVSMVSGCPACGTPWVRGPG